MSVDLVDAMGSDASIVNAARVSTIGARSVGELKETSSAKGLINYLMRDRHGTPFEHNALTFKVSAPLFVFYEWHRHRAGWSYNEESARYRELDPVFYVPAPDRNLRQIGKPGAYTFELGTGVQMSATLYSHKWVAEQCWREYQDMLNRGIAREVARNVLPVSIYKMQYATCNLRSLFSFLSLRWAHPLSTVPSFPLAEIQAVAQKLDELARPYFPLAFQAFDEHGRVSP
ncbi:MAG: FAD-dependent thymidylate synthase [Gemmatimonadaceae bacterium]